MKFCPGIKQKNLRRLEFQVLLTLLLSSWSELSKTNLCYHQNQIKAHFIKLSYYTALLQFGKFKRDEMIGEKNKNQTGFLCSIFVFAEKNFGLRSKQRNKYNGLRRQHGEFGDDFVFLQFNKNNSVKKRQNHPYIIVISNAHKHRKKRWIFSNFMLRDWQQRKRNKERCRFLR